MSDTWTRLAESPWDKEVRGEAASVSPPAVLNPAAPVDGPPARVKLGVETAAEALAAVAAIRAADAKLEQVVAETSAPWELARRLAVWSCPRCQGKLHSVGQNRLPDGRRVAGGLLVCEACGTFERAR